MGARMLCWRRIRRLTFKKLLMLLWVRLTSSALILTMFRRSLYMPPPMVSTSLVSSKRWLLVNHLDLINLACDRRGSEDALRSGMMDCKQWHVALGASTNCVWITEWFEQWLWKKTFAFLVLYCFQRELALCPGQCPVDIDTLLECGPMPNLMVALPNIGGTLCSTPQSLPDAHY